MTTLNHQFRLARRPVGLAQRSDFDYGATPQQASTFFNAESEKFIGIAKTLNLVPQ